MKGKITMYENNKEDDFTSTVSVVLRRKDIEMLKTISHSFGWEGKSLAIRNIISRYYQSLDKGELRNDNGTKN